MMWNISQLSWFWPVCTAVALMLLSLGIILFSRRFSNNVDRDAVARRQQAALATARERFARSEITTEEFEVLKRGLKS